MLWLYDAATGDTKVLLDPSKSPDNIDVTSAQWSPQGDRLLLTGDTALWLLDLSTGKLTSLVENTGNVTGQMFTPDGTRISYVQDNDLYVVGIADGQVQRLTTDGGETVFNGALDWVYNEELATRAAQPAYAWSPDGVWLIYLRLDESAVHNDPVTDYRPVPATVSYTRYPTVGTPNPVATLHAQAQGATAPPLEVPLPAGAEYVLPVLHLDAGLQPRALHYGEPGSHRADAEHVDPAERRTADLDQGNRPRLDQRRSLCGSRLPSASSG